MSGSYEDWDPQGRRSSQSSPSSPSQPFSPASSSLPPPKFNVPAIIAMVAPLLCCSPLGLILAIVAVLQTKDGAQRGRGLAIAALVINALLLAFSIVAVAIAPDDPTTVTVTKQNAHQVADDLEKQVDQDR